MYYEGSLTLSLIHFESDEDGVLAEDAAGNLGVMLDVITNRVRNYWNRNLALGKARAKVRARIQPDLPSTPHRIGRQGKTFLPYLLYPYLVLLRHIYRVSPDFSESPNAYSGHGISEAPSPSPRASQ